MLSQSISDMASSVGGGDQGEVGGAVLVFLPGAPISPVLDWIKFTSFKIFQKLMYVWTVRYTGENEISRVKNFLEKKAREFGQEWWILPLHSKIPQEELRQVIF